jgi:hypothetical protein
MLKGLLEFDTLGSRAVANDALWINRSAAPQTPLSRSPCNHSCTPHSADTSHHLPGSPLDKGGLCARYPCSRLDTLERDTRCGGARFLMSKVPLYREPGIETRMARDARRPAAASVMECIRATWSSIKNGFALSHARARALSLSLSRSLSLALSLTPTPLGPP